MLLPLVLAPARLEARSPAPPPCGGSSATQKAAERRAERLAQGVFPSIKLVVSAMGCRHFGFSVSDPMQVPFDSFELADPAARDQRRL